jgi:hypothetical protein
MNMNRWDLAAFIFFAGLVCLVGYLTRDRQP